MRTIALFVSYWILAQRHSNPRSHTKKAGSVQLCKQDCSNQIQNEPWLRLEKPQRWIFSVINDVSFVLRLQSRDSEAAAAADLLGCLRLHLLLFLCRINDEHRCQDFSIVRTVSDLFWVSKKLLIVCHVRQDQPGSLYFPAVIVSDI